MRMNGRWAMVAGYLALAGTQGTWAQQKWSYPNCPDVSSADFTKVVLVSKATDPTLNEPTRMYPAPDGRVFFSERNGKLKIFKPSAPGAGAGTIVTAATFDVYSGTNKDGSQSESGINGFTLDPHFEDNHYIYVDYAPATDSIWRMSRFRMNGDVVDKASEKELFRVPTQRVHCCHTGGGMAWDLEGNLWMTLGNNTANPIDNASLTSFIDESSPNGIGDDQAHAANTNDLRGKIIRIHPNPDGSYSIPKGNLFPEGMAKTRPEIYTMGHRNAYTLAVDPYRHWLAWGDVGPDEHGETEEHNLVTKPGFMGWPYFVGGPNSPTTSAGGTNYSYRGNKDPGAPKNNSKWNTGLVDLPPAVPAILPYRESAAITGPLFHYDGANPSRTKLPPHFDGKWFITDWNRGGGYLKVVTLNEAGTAVTDNRPLLEQGTLVGPIDLKIGPDGALYVLEYGGTYFSTTNDTKLSRYEYKGSCLPSEPKLPTSLRGMDAARTRSGLLARLAPGLDRVIDVPRDAKSFRVFDLQGKTVWESRVEGTFRVALPGGLGNGLYQVRFEY